MFTVGIIAIICLVIGVVLIKAVPSHRRPPIDNDRLRHMTQREIDRIGR